jgi:flagellar assembly protein FliH
MSPQRFTFDRAFPQTADRVVPIEKKEPTVALSEHERLMAAAHAAGRQQGFLEGKAEADGAFAAHLARATETLAYAMEAVRADLDAIQARASGEAVMFAEAFARHLAGSLLDAAPMARIEDAARRVFDDLRGQPHVAARVSPALADATKERLSAIARERGFEGRLIVLGEPEIADGDVRIEWADGGVVRDRAAVERRLADAVAQALAAQAGPGGFQSGVA